MPMKVFGISSSNTNQNRIDRTIFEQKPYLRTIYVESNTEEDIDLNFQ